MKTKIIKLIVFLIILLGVSELEAQRPRRTPLGRSNRVEEPSLSTRSTPNKARKAPKVSKEGVRKLPTTPLEEFPEPNCSTSLKSSPSRGARNTLSKKEQHELITSITRKYKNYQCYACVNDLVEQLKAHNIRGTILTIRVRNPSVPSNHNIYSDSEMKLISTGGNHKAVLVNNLVYDNIHKNGVSLSEWTADLHSPAGFDIIPEPF
ncbi:MAG: papain fold toxin domain-containing protein [Cyanobacteria bacterium J06649_11]